MGDVAGRAERAGTADSARQNRESDTGDVPGVVLALVGGHGSPGRSTLALSLATALGAAASAIVAELGTTGASLAALTDADPTLNLAMLSYADPRTPADWDRAIARETQAIRPSVPGAHALCGLPKPEMRGSLDAGFVARLVAALAQRYRYVVLDLDAGLLGDQAAVQHAALSRADRVLLVTTADVVGLLHARQALGSLRTDYAVPPERIGLVVNRYDARYHHGRREIEWALEAPVAAIIPHDHRAAQRALAAQHPLIMQRRSRAARALLDLARRIHGGDAGAIVLPEEEPSRTALWTRRLARNVIAVARGVAGATRAAWEAGASPAQPAAAALALAGPTAPAMPAPPPTTTPPAPHATPPADAAGGRDDRAA